MLIETRKVRDRLAGVLGRAGQLQGLGTVEAVAQADLAGLLAVGLLEIVVSTGSEDKSDIK